VESALPPAVSGTPRILLRSEGFALFALATAGFAASGLSWWLYAALFLAPDVSFAAYGAGPRVGAVVYNGLHTTIVPAALAALGLILDATTLLGLAAVWAAHIGFDRMLGYGLKYETSFADTHLGRTGRSKARA
jgi:hypothetical protein